MNGEDGEIEPPDPFSIRISKRRELQFEESSLCGEEPRIGIMAWDLKGNSFYPEWLGFMCRVDVSALVDYLTEWLDQIQKEEEVG